MTYRTSDDSNGVYVRYLLRDSSIPRRLDAPRPAVYITLEAPDLDQRGKPLFEGDVRAIANVRTSLGELRASGIRGLRLSELPTPRNLLGVMESPHIRRYEPVCVAGLQLFLVVNHLDFDVWGRLGGASPSKNAPHKHRG